MKAHVYTFLAVMFLVLLAIALTRCKLEPAKVPPCTGTERWPDPCAASARDAGVDG